MNIQPMCDVKSTESTSNCVPKHRNCHDSFTTQDMQSPFGTAVQLALLHWSLKVPTFIF